MLTRKIFLTFNTMLMAGTFMSFSACAQDDDRTAGSKPETEVSNSSETYRQLNLFGDVFGRLRMSMSMHDHGIAIGRQPLADHRPNGSASPRDKRALLDHHTAALTKIDARPSMSFSTPCMRVK